MDQRQKVLIGKRRQNANIRALYIVILILLFFEFPEKGWQLPAAVPLIFGILLISLDIFLAARDEKAHDFIFKKLLLFIFFSLILTIPSCGKGTAGLGITGSGGPDEFNVGYPIPYLKLGDDNSKTPFSLVDIRESPGHLTFSWLSLIAIAVNTIVWLAVFHVYDNIQKSEQQEFLKIFTKILFIVFLIFGILATFPIISAGIWTMLFLLLAEPLVSPFDPYGNFGYSVVHTLLVSICSLIVTIAYFAWRKIQEKRQEFSNL